MAKRRMIRLARQRKIVMIPPAARLRPPLTRHIPSMKYPLRFALLLLPLLTLTSLHAEEKAETPPLLPGRYVLITQGNPSQVPLIVNVLKKDDSLLLSVEDPEYTDVPIRIEEGVAIFQLSRRVKAPQLESVREYLMNFAGVPSKNLSPGGLEGSFSLLLIFPKGDTPSSPFLSTGNFLLFPIDKDK